MYEKPLPYGRGFFFHRGTVRNRFGSGGFCLAADEHRLLKKEGMSMAMTVAWTLMILAAVLYGAATGHAEAVGAAAAEGALRAVELAISMGGMVCLWTGVMEVLRRCGTMDALARALRPLLGRLFPAARRDRETMQALSANVSANLLGLGNAATPAGIQAALRLKELSGTDRASNELCRLVVMNTASVQLLPTTVAALRSAAGAADAFDILPAVWISSAASVCVGLLAARLLEGRT